jgi:hypothetical protein
MNDRLPDPSLTRIYRLEATLGAPLDLGDVAQGHRRIVPLTGGTFTGPELNGTLLRTGLAYSIAGSGHNQATSALNDLSWVLKDFAWFRQRC